MNLIGDVRGKVAVLVDDMIDTAGTAWSYCMGSGCTCVGPQQSAAREEAVGLELGGWRRRQRCVLGAGGRRTHGAAATRQLPQRPCIDRRSLSPPPPPLAGTITNAAKVLHAEGAREVYACATHAVFSPPAVERLSSGIFQVRLRFRLRGRRACILL